MVKIGIAGGIRETLFADTAGRNKYAGLAAFAEFNGTAPDGPHPVSRNRP
ncbi:MAG: hypothetical protein LBK61_11355 [Spirochaetaceae bacterium]|nr:hypothetical protein [Spirochaetaceae bacterium]